MSTNFDFAEPTSLPSEGNRGVRALCGLARAIGHVDTTHFGTLNDGSCVGDLICFLEDNPGAIQAIYQWVEENYEDELNEMRADDAEDGDE